ncbi:ABC-2 type transport system ATP-binding protein [Halogranum amylolyticum]|uniref:ABC-2 type transport system ATP-binding protein n=1 Tax=Halogranum amylolyticum TaxID=660520 RepID=A0A1H8N0X1_9EURY|nr:ABC transporter ATP-binding protein [Halogranum amylolyticum]SEO23202.1 ABC-2 type transport system ATP-binding protein [Halogranum amylolyticum]
MPASPAIELSGLTKYYGDVCGIEDLTLTVDRGEIFGFLGPNGAGKSTAIRTFLGFLRPTAGEAYLLGTPVSDRRALIEVKREIGHIPGDFAFYDSLTGRRHLDYFERLRGGDRREELERLFPAPFDRKVRTYSRGNRQKLAIVQAFMHDPTLVVMDEPTAGLDPLVQQTFYEFLEAERDRGVTTLFSSHVLSEVRRVCDRVAVIRNGRLAAVEEIDALLRKSGKVVRASLAERPPVESFDLPGVVRGEYESGGVLRLVVNGGYDELLDRLAGYTVEDVEIREASLEDVFMHFYTGQDVDSAGDGTTPDVASVTEPTDV